MIKIVIVEDEAAAVERLSEMLLTIDYEIKIVHILDSVVDSIDYFSQHHDFDLIFMDIHLSDGNSFDIFKHVTISKPIIFTTAYSEYAVEGFNLNAVDYLLKPFTLERFQQAIKKAQDYYSYSRQLPGTVNQSLYIRADYSLIKINFSEIVLIESLDDYLKIYLTNDKIIVARMTMKSMVEKLPVIDFIRVHRSFIVPFNKISHVRNKIITISNKEIPIGGNYEEAFFRVFKV